ncbi:MAG: hypothetical protein LBN95_05275 [Prevotellaceae bacterium]|jgi:hypothetical protein|nr:hypothetical protein [Prevotellaceae bacterium]
MLKKTLLISLMILTAVGVEAKKPVNKLIPQNLPKDIAYSTGFTAFYNDLAIEAQGLTTLADYEPSNKMLELYTFVKLPNGKMGIEGFLQVNSVFFDAYGFEKLGGYLTYVNEGIYKYQISVENIFKITQIRGVLQIDIPEKRIKK